MQVYNTTFVQADFAHGTALAFLLAAATAVLGVLYALALAEGDGMTSRSAGVSRGCWRSWRSWPGRSARS